MADGGVSLYIVAIVAGWTVSQLVKSLISLSKRKYMGLRSVLFVSGGMPSSHSATLMAVWTVILLTEGVNSAVFGLASAVALIVLYDAVKVRRSSGEQGVALLALLRSEKSIIPAPRVAMGHTPLEVVVGSILGVAIGFVICLIGT
jgi:acid phosphatase family membrane protein YuiD